MRTGRRTRAGSRAPTTPITSTGVLTDELPDRPGRPLKRLDSDRCPRPALARWKRLGAAALGGELPALRMVVLGDPAIPGRRPFGWAALRAFGGRMLERGSPHAR